MTPHSSSPPLIFDAHLDLAWNAIGWSRDPRLPAAEIRRQEQEQGLERAFRHAALGTGLDGGFGREQAPYDLDTIADLQRLPELLRRRGGGEQASAGILDGNWVRFFRDAWHGTG